FFFSSRRRHTSSKRDWSSDVCSSDLSTSGATSTPPRWRIASARPCTPMDFSWWKSRTKDIISPRMTRPPRSLRCSGRGAGGRRWSGLPLETQGFGDLENDLTNMAAALEFGSGVDRALQAGAKPIEEQMLHNASTDPKIITGALHGSIHTGKVKRRRAGGKA